LFKRHAWCLCRGNDGGSVHLGSTFFIVDVIQQ